MIELERVQKLMAYNAWANIEADRSLLRLPSISVLPERTPELMAHVIGTEWNWLARIRGEQPRTAIWPKIAPPDLERELADVQSAWRACLEGQPDDELSRVVAYVKHCFRHRDACLLPLRVPPWPDSASSECDRRPASDDGLHSLRAYHRYGATTVTFDAQQGRLKGAVKLRL